MSFTLTNAQFGTLLHTLLIDPDAVGEICEGFTHQRFVAALAEVVAEYTGHVTEPAAPGETRFTPTLDAGPALSEWASTVAAD